VKDQLYLLKPGFFNATLGPLYCSDSLPVEGMLGFFPQLRNAIDVHYVEFPRPRAPLIKLLGEANQSIPVLVLAAGRRIIDTTLEPRQANGRMFFADERSIRQYLSAQYDLAQAG